MRNHGIFLISFEIICLQETWFDIDKEKNALQNLNNNYKWLTVPAYRENIKGRAKGGILVGLKNEKIQGNFEIIDCKFALLIKNIKFRNNDPLTLCIVYSNEGIDNSLSGII